jgi:glycosyltransferase involved in cell wall biosynthesis
MVRAAISISESILTRTVVHFIESEIFGGAEEVALSLLSGLDRRTWQPMLFHHGSPALSRVTDEMNRLGIPSRVVPRMNRRNYWVSIPRFVSELRKAAPSIFHVHLSWPLSCRQAVTVARLTGVPVVVATSHLHSDLDGVRLAWLKQRLQSACLTKYLAVSDEVKHRLSDDLGVAPSKICVVRNGIRLNAHSSPPNPALRASLSGGTERPIVFTPARLHSQKGHVDLLEAAALVPDAIFVLAGDGPERPALEAQARSLGIEGRVRFLGHRTDIPQLLAVSDLFVLPSLYEGLPLSVLEAMAAGKPVIATQIGGTSEAVTNGETGVLVMPRDSNALAAAIQRMLTDHDLASRLAQSALDRVRQEFSSDVMVRNVSRIYQELLASA